MRVRTVVGVYVAVFVAFFVFAPASVGLFAAVAVKMVIGFAEASLWVLGLGLLVVAFLAAVELVDRIF
jgi:hypothetical protein